LYGKIIKKIKDFDLLNESDIKTLNLLSPELKRSFESNQIWRSETEMRYSVLNNLRFPTAKSKYWQSVREQSVFYQELILLVFTYEKESGYLDLYRAELLDLDQDTLKGRARIKIKNAEIKEKEFALYNMKLQAKDRLRELKLWEKIKNEQLKLDPTIDIDDFSSHHKEMYEKRWTKEMDLARMTNNPETYKNSRSNLETLQNDS
jgi:hypothetical protein